MSEVTRILEAVEQGDRQAAEELLPLVYDELRKLAAARMAAEAPGHTLNATALVHEAYLRLVGNESAPVWNGRGHFFAAAAEAMRRILIDHARRRQAGKRGGASPRVSMSNAEVSYTSPDEELLAINDALGLLAEEDARSAQLVKLRYFGGLSVEDAAESLGISRTVAFQHWAYARARLRCLLPAE